MSELLSVARGLKDAYSLSKKQKKNISSHGSPKLAAALEQKKIKLQELCETKSLN